MENIQYYFISNMWAENKIIFLHVKNARYLSIYVNI